MDEKAAKMEKLSSAAAFVEGGVQDACDDACSICLEAFCDSDPSTVATSLSCGLHGDWRTKSWWPGPYLMLLLFLVLDCRRSQAASMISISSASLSGEDHAFSVFTVFLEVL
jgi:hypothetical protein